MHHALEALDHRCWILLSFLLVSIVTAVGVPHTQSSITTRRAASRPADRLVSSENGAVDRFRGGLDPAKGEAFELRPTSGSLDLLEIALVTCTDGSLHGIRRATGEKVWSVEGHSSSQASLFGPAVATTYGPGKLKFSDAMVDSGMDIGLLENSGVYVLEPSGSGDIYVLSADGDASGGLGSSLPNLKLSKLPLNLPQLVALSPFAFAGDDSRLFVGKKESKLVEIDLLTGEVGAIYAQDAFTATNANRGRRHGYGGADRPSRVNGWAIVARTDYSLSIHAKHDSRLTQSLNLSLYSSNLADREMIAAWTSQAYPDLRRLLGLPEEGTLLCLNASTTSSATRTGRNPTLWSTEMPSPIAAIFDIVQRRGPDMDTTPVIVPHPPLQLPRSLVAVAERDAESGVQNAYVGLADGTLFAMSAERYPLAALSPSAPASQQAENDQRYGRADNDWRSQPIFGRPLNPCQSHHCWLGSYPLTTGDIDSGDWAIRDMLLGASPLLGGIDSGVRVPTLDAPRDSSSTPPVPARSDEVPPSHEGSPIESHGPRLSPGLLFIQALAICGIAVITWAVWTGFALQDQQRAQEVSLLAKQVVFVDGMDTKRESAGDRNGVIPSHEIATLAANPQPEEVSQTNDSPSRQEPDQAPADAKPRKISPEEDEVPDDRGTSKSAAAKKRRRGKRAGQAVAAKLAKMKAGDDPAAIDARSSEVVISAETPVSDSLNESKSPQETEQATFLVTDAHGKGPVTSQEQKPPLSSLIISDDVLGYGSSGTVVFKGTFQGRAVAVKRLLRDFVSIASKEVSLLETADDHPNVVRYFYQEMTDNFLYIALERCAATLAEIVEKPIEHRDLGNLLRPKQALQQITMGLRHLHSLSIVHRDLKPQNILVSITAKGHLKMLLSDFGLSKRLDGLTQTSFSQTINNPGGTVGWRAPEILRGDVSLEPGAESSETSLELRMNLSSKEEKTRLTRAVDIFALGCVAYYLLSNGNHPFGSRFERELNVLKGVTDLTHLDSLGEEGNEARNLVLACVQPDPSQRPTASEIPSHPFFWDANKRLSFLTNASDRFDILERDPPAPLLLTLESKAIEVIGTSWHRRLDQIFVQDLGKFRSYDARKVQDLLRAMRNKSHHYQDMQPRLQQLVGPLPEGFLTYFTNRFPRLFLHVYETIVSQPFIRSEPRFRHYFDDVVMG